MKNIYFVLSHHQITSCTFERPPDDNIYCILAYVLGQPPSSEISTFANVTSVFTIIGDHRVRISFGVVLAFLLLLVVIISLSLIYCIY